uniref:Uncharacterized protein n=1 Tax=Tanacetum cinerariifolium TaxID=118510 RepID=A0A6L2LEI3_TANCI|nr:hypothetical protein [Tanacetum cinerariifolium]
MSYITAQQAKLDLELVPREKRLEIRKCNERLNPRKIKREPTFQVILDALALTPCYYGFFITADVPEVYMHQFWDFVYMHDTFYRLKMDKRKRLKLTLEIFRDIMKICPRTQETPEMPLCKKKEKVDVDRGKGIELLFEVALTKEAQYEVVRKKRLRDFHKTHLSGSGTITKTTSSAAKIMLGIKYTRHSHCQGEGSGTPTEPHHTPFLEAETPHPTTSSIPLPSIPTAPIPSVTQPDTTPIRQYTRRARIDQSSTLPTVADEPASLVRDVSEGEACPTDSGFIADQDRATIAKSSTLPHDSAPRVTSPAADERSMQHNISKLTALCTRDRVKVLEDKEDVAITQSGDDAPIKGRSINEGEAAAERISNDSEEVVRVLTSIDAATVLAGGIDVPTGSGFIPPATIISTDSEVGPTVSLIITRRKGKEVMMESDTLKKKKLQEQIDAQRRPMTKKQKREYYTAVIKSNLGWRFKDFKGMTFEEIEAKFAEVWKQVEDFIPMGSKEETERLKRKGLNLEKEQVKKQKSSEEAPKIETSTKEFTKEKIKEMMQRIEMPLPEVCNAIEEKKKKLPVKDRWQLH